MAACEGGDEEKGLVVASWGWAGAAFPFTFGRGDASSCVVLWQRIDASGFLSFFF
jgi:hypothetical protein